MPSVDTDFDQLIDEYYTAWNTGNPDNAAKFYAKDEGVIIYDLTPLQYRGWEEYKDGIRRNLMSKLTGGSVTQGNDLKIVRRENVAWTTMTNHFSFKLKDGRMIETDARHTAIWERRRDKWLIVHEHISAPMLPF
jgi:ketosteroid isomerase-like protein